MPAAHSALRIAVWRPVLFVMVIAAVSTAQAEDAERYAPRAFRAAMAKVLPSVVTIETYGSGAGGPVAAPKPKPKPRRGRGRPRRIGALSRPGEGPTTGLVISAEGHILTSTFNFLRRPGIITVVFPNGSQKVAKLVGSDEMRKICVLKVEDVEGLPTPEIAPADSLRVGQWAVSVGVGYGGEEPAMSVGLISALERVSGRAVQTDANISPANYGGPLVDIDGRVIGLCVPLNPMGASAAAGVEWYDSGIGFAIPLAEAAPIIERLKQGETIQAGRLGVMLKPVGNAGGVRITKIAPGSPAEQAGLEVGDAIIGINSARVIDMLGMRIATGRYAAGETVIIEFTRKGKQASAKVTLAAGPFKMQEEKKDEKDKDKEKPEDKPAEEPEAPEVD
jgi:serine protease Do